MSESNDYSMLSKPLAAGEAGFSLISTLVSFALLGLFTMLLTSAMVQANSGARHVKQVVGYQNVKASVQSLLSNPKRCKDSLGSVSRTISSRQRLKIRNGSTVLFQKGQVLTREKLEITRLYAEREGSSSDNPMLYHLRLEAKKLPGAGGAVVGGQAYGDDFYVNVTYGPNGGIRDCIIGSRPGTWHVANSAKAVIERDEADFDIIAINPPMCREDGDFSSCPRRNSPAVDYKARGNKLDLNYTTFLGAQGQRHATFVTLRIRNLSTGQWIPSPRPLKMVALGAQMVGSLQTDSVIIPVTPGDRYRFFVTMHSTQREPPGPGEQTRSRMGNVTLKLTDYIDNGNSHSGFVAAN